MSQNMQNQIKISYTIQELLQCPTCRTKLNYNEGQFVCSNTNCNQHFPIVDGIPVLLNEQTSVFSNEDFILHRKTFFGSLPKENKLKNNILRFIPTIGNSIRARDKFNKFLDLLLGLSSNPRVLVIGGSILGQGMEQFADSSLINLVESDVAFGPRTMLIFDSHDIPFEDGSFDGIVIQAVLEHVVDPYRCVEEIHRVLNKHGVVYAETPFMQQVHGGRYDFMRFTYLGHRRLFRWFDEIDSGVICGPGMALAWSYQYFLMSFTNSKILRKYIKLFASLTSFFLKYFDYYLINKSGALDAASGYFFLGRKGKQALSDSDLIKLYKGGN